MKKLFIGLSICTLFASCNLQQTILRGGCTTHEFANFNVAANTDSTGFYVVCDNATLVKQYPSLAAKLLKQRAQGLPQGILK